jgi:hypothetical protein
MNKTLKIVLIFAAIGLVIGVSIGLYLFTKKSPTDFASKKADYTMTADVIFNEFTLNQDTASGKYYGKIIELSSIVKEANLADTANLFVIIGEGADVLVSCKFSADYLEQLKAIGIGQPISVKGEIAGFDDLFMQLNLQRCSLIE